ncbi:MAG: serine--tRNA ligase [Bacteroidota bacterium]|nr:serine--tRNA ligase [Bacteroidota bacterium]
MISIAYLRDNPEDVVHRLKKKHFDARETVDNVLRLDEHRRKLQKSLDDNLAESNRLAKEIGALFREKKDDQAEEMKGRTVTLKEDARKLEAGLQSTERELQDNILVLPNLPHASVPEGKTAENNEVVRTGGKRPALNKDAMPHWELAKKYDLIDFELGNKITGAGFPVYKGKGARLQRALINFFLNEAINAGYTEYQPPILINEESGYGTGQLPDKEGQMYFAEKDNLYLIPTAEVPLTNIYRDVILKHDHFPIMLTGYTPCFRREAGSYGKDVRGLNRLHQFDKVEIVRIERPENSYGVLEEMVSYVENLVKSLGLEYRILRLCGGDMSFGSALTYDFEVYSAAQDKWLEISSVSNFETFQANRLKLRYKDKDGKMNIAHTLNGSALALPRIVAALLENNQTADGIRLPEVLRPYTGFENIN